MVTKGTNQKTLAIWLELHNLSVEFQDLEVAAGCFSKTKNFFVFPSTHKMFYYSLIFQTEWLVEKLLNSYEHYYCFCETAHMLSQIVAGHS